MIGGTVGSACLPGIVKGLWANEPAAGEAEGGGSLAYSVTQSAHNGCPPGQVVTELGCEDLISLLQRKVDEYRDRFATDPSARDAYLSARERAAEAANPWVRPMNNGKSIERAVADDPLVDTHFTHLGGAARPDFIARSTGDFFEVTTTNASTIAHHLSRWYVDAERIVKYVMWTFGG